MNKSKAIFICLLILTLTGVYILVTGKIASNKETLLLSDTELMLNYRNFQYVASQKAIALMPNNKARELPEIKKILDAREHILKEKAPACKVEYYASYGTPSAGFTPIKVHCDPMLWWK